MAPRTSASNPVVRPPGVRIDRPFTEHNHWVVATRRTNPERLQAAVPAAAIVSWFR